VHPSAWKRIAAKEFAKSHSFGKPETPVDGMEAPEVVAVSSDASRRKAKEKAS
jgi:TPP-dependent pyruvate/acetoin dehydrogenase alpha subunit